TTWPQSCAVAEKKLFEYPARNAMQNSSHQNCLHIFSRILVGTGFPTYVIKTVVMHLLTTIPLENWHRRFCLYRLDDILSYLRSCLEEKCLNHYFLGNKMVPDDIVLPQAFRSASPLNLFQHLEQDPNAHSQALKEFRELRERLKIFLIF
ncbi:IPIL1 protein, partial [Alectura lathami]|nr:IPIL1 protein [Alectura lathami]